MPGHHPAKAAPGEEDITTADRDDANRQRQRRVRATANSPEPLASGGAVVRTGLKLAVRRCKTLDNNANQREVSWEAIPQVPRSLARAALSTEQKAEVARAPHTAVEDHSPDGRTASLT